MQRLQPLKDDDIWGFFAPPTNYPFKCDKSTGISIHNKHRANTTRGVRACVHHNVELEQEDIQQSLNYAAWAVSERSIQTTPA